MRFKFFQCRLIFNHNRFNGLTSRNASRKINLTREGSHNLLTMKRVWSIIETHLIWPSIMLFGDRTRSDFPQNLRVLSLWL
jgi:hypothetical protein